VSDLEEAITPADHEHKNAQMVYDDGPEPAGAIDDERLRLIFTCCHPALAMQTRVALTLPSNRRHLPRLGAGQSSGQI
jgi:predicted RNA polymerase sigma factor